MFGPSGDWQDGIGVALGIAIIRERLGEELWPIAGTNVSWHATSNEQLAQNINDVRRVELAPDSVSQALVREFIDDIEHAIFPFLMCATACAVLGVSESGFYAWKSWTASPRQRDDMVLLAHIRAEFSTSNETYGSPRMLVELRENGMKAPQKTRFKKTTDSDHGGPVTPNIRDQNFATDAPNEKWGVMRDACFQHDISYVWTAEGWLYLAIVVDLFSRRIVG